MKKIERLEKKQRIEESFTPAKEAKKEAIGYLGKLGKKYSWAKYPIFAVTVVFIFLYNFFLHLFIHMRMKEKLSKACAVVMTLAMIAGSMDLAAFAVSGQDYDDYYNLVSLSDDELNLDVKYATREGKIGLPDTITANVEHYVYVEKEVPVGTPDEQAANMESVNEVSENVEEGQLPENTEEGQLPENTEEGQLPEITEEEGQVIEIAADGSVITEEENNEPATKTVLVPVLQGIEAVEVDVTWSCENYDRFTPGSYVFRATPSDTLLGCELMKDEALNSVYAVVNVREEDALVLNKKVEGTDLEVELWAAKGVFTEGADLRVKVIEDPEQLAGIRTAVQSEVDELNEYYDEDKVTDYVAFDVEVLDDEGNELQPNIPEGVNREDVIKLSFKEVKEELQLSEQELENLSDEEMEQELDVFYVNNELTKAEKQESEVDSEDVVSIAPEHFSIYVCANHTHPTYKNVATWSALYKAVYNQTGSVNLKLTSDITAEYISGYSTSRYLNLNKSSCSVNLNLNGHTLTGASGQSQTIYVYKGKLYIHDTVGTGAIDGTGTNYAVYNASGTVIQYAGTIKGANTAQVGVSNGTFTMEGGCVDAGSKVGVELNSGTYNGNAGEIINGSYGIKSGGTGSAVNIGKTYIKNYSYIGVYASAGNVYLGINASKNSAGIISGNSANKTYGVYATGAAVTMYYMPAFVYNKQGDIYLDLTKGSLITFATGFAANGKASVITDKSVKAGEFISTNIVSGAENYFTSAESSSYEAWAESGKVKLGAKPDCNITVAPENIYSVSAAANDEKAGTVQIGTSAATKDTASTIVKYGATVTVKAVLTDAERYDFTGWYEGSTKVSSDKTYSFVAKKENINLKARFTKKKFQIYVNSALEEKGTVTGTGVYEYDQVVAIKATPKSPNVFKQWNDGDTSASRNITVKGTATYTAQFGIAEASATATGYIYTNVKQWTSKPTNFTTYQHFLLLYNSTIAQVDSNSAIAKLTSGSARLDYVSSSGKDFSWYQGKNRSSVTTSGSYAGIDGYYYGNTANTTGFHVKVVEKGSGFDGCSQGYVCYFGSPAKSGQKPGWAYWCNGSGVQQCGPYNLYSYDLRASYKAGNISAKMSKDFTPSQATQDIIDEATIDIKITPDGSSKSYNLVGLDFSDNVINYSIGDKTAVFDVGGVLYTYVFPEAIINGTEYRTIEKALEEAKNGDHIEIVGPAVSEVTDDTEVKSGVTIENYDGSKVTTGEQSKVQVANDGTVDLIEGSVTVTPKNENQDAKVNLQGGTVISDKEITVRTENGQSTVTVNDDADSVKISPDGDPNHTVEFFNCEQGSEYGLNGGTLDKEDKVVISEGTEYDLKVNLGENETTISTDSANNGNVTVTKGEEEIKVESEKKNDTISVKGGLDEEPMDTTITTNTDNTVIVIKKKSSEEGEGQPSEKTEVSLEKGSVDVGDGGEIVANGEKIKNGSGTGQNITVTVGEEGEGTGISVPNGGEAVIGDGDNPVVIKVPEAKEGEAENLPTVVEIKEDGTIGITTEPGNPVTIGDQEYTAGNFDTEFEITPPTEEGGEPEVVVKDGSVELKPGQSIKDSNGVVYTNPGDPDDPDAKPISLTMTEGENTEIKAEGGTEFSYQLPGEEEPTTYKAAGSGESTFSVNEEGDVKLESEIELGNGKEEEIVVSIGGEDVSIKQPEGNQGEVQVDPMQGTITVTKEGDSVEIDGVTYKSASDDTVLKMGADGPEIVSGGVTVEEGQSIIVKNNEVLAGDTPVDVVITPEGVEVTTPAGGSVKLADPKDPDSAVELINDGEESTSFILDEEGSLMVAPGSEFICRQGEDDVQIGTEFEGVTIKPTTEGLDVKAPTGTSIEINGVAYENKGETESYTEEGSTEEQIYEPDLELIISKEGDVVLSSGTVGVPEEGKINLIYASVENEGGGDVVLDDNGNIELSENAKIKVEGPNGENEIIAKTDNTKIEMDPTTGEMFIRAGSAELSKDSEIKVVYNHEEAKDVGDEHFDEVNDTAVVKNIGDVMPTVNGDGTIDIPANGVVQIDSEIDGQPVSNTIKVPENSEVPVKVKPQTDGTFDVGLGEGGSVFANGTAYTANEDDTLINIGTNGAELTAGSVQLDENEAINVNDVKVKNTGSTSTPVVAKSNEDGTAGIIAPPSGEFSINTAGGTEQEFVFTNPSETPAEYSVDTEGNLVLKDGAPIALVTEENQYEVSGSGDVKVKVTEKGLSLDFEKNESVTVGESTIINTTESGELELIVDESGDPVLLDGNCELTSESSVFVKTADGNKVEITSKSEELQPEIEVKEGVVTVKVPESGEVEINGVLYKASAPGTEITIDESGAVLESGEISLGGGNETPSGIIVNGKTVTNEGPEGTEVTVFKDTEGTGCKVSPGGEFAVAVPGEEESKAVFKNPSEESEGTYVITEEGAILLGDNTAIEFAGPDGRKEELKVDLAEEGNMAKLEVTEDGLEVTVGLGSEVTIKDKAYTALSEEMVLLKDGEDNIILEEGKVELLQNESIFVADGEELIEVLGTAEEGSEGAKVEVTEAGTLISAPAGTEVPIMVGDKEFSVLTKGTEETVTKLIPTKDGIKLEEGDVELSKDKEVILGNVVYENISENEEATVEIIKNNDETVVKVSEGGAFAMQTPGEEGQAIIVSNPSDEAEAVYTISPEGEIIVDKDSSIEAEVGENKVVIEPGDADAKISASKNGIKVTIAPGESIVVGEGESARTIENGSSTEELVISINEKSQIIVEKGTYNAAPGLVVYFMDEEETLVPVIIAADGYTGQPLKLNEKGEAAAPAGLSFSIGSNEYTNPGPGNAELGYDTKTGLPVLEEGNVEVEAGCAVGLRSGDNSIDEVSTKSSISGDKVSVAANGDVTIPTGVTAEFGSQTETGMSYTKVTAPEGTDEVQAKVKKTAGLQSELEVAVDAEEKVIINDATYENLDASEEMLLSKSPESNQVVLEEGTDVKVTDGNLVVEGTEVVTNGDKGVIVKNKGEGNKPVINVPNGGNAAVGDASTGKLVEVKVPENKEDPEASTEVTVDPSGKLCVEVEEGEKVTIGGITYTSTEDGKIVVNGENGELDTEETTAEVATTISSEDFNRENYAVDIPGDGQVAVDDVIYEAPEGGVTLSGNPEGMPVINVEEPNTPVKVDDKTYVSDSPETKYVVNKDGSVNLLDNGNPEENSALKVEGEDSIKVDGVIIENKSDDSGFSIGYGEEGNKLTVYDNSKVDLVMDEHPTTINLEGIMSEAGTPLFIQSGEPGVEFTVDMTTKGEGGEIIPSIVPKGDYVLEPVKNPEGQVLGFVLVNPVKPGPVDPDPVKPDPVDPVPPTDDPVIDEPEDEPIVEEPTYINYPVYVADNGPTLDNYISITADTVEDIKEVTLEQNAYIKLGQGSLEIEIPEDTSVQLKSFVLACLSDEDLKGIEEGQDVKIRLRAVLSEGDVSKTEKDDIQKKIDELKDSDDSLMQGLILGGFYNISIERKTGIEDWVAIHELKEGVEIELEIPKDLVKEDRTFWMLRDHDGEVTQLEDRDKSDETITVLTDRFSVYALIYADMENENAIELHDDIAVDEAGSSGVAPMVWIIISVIIIALIAFIIIKRRRDDEEEY